MYLLISELMRIKKLLEFLGDDFQNRDNRQLDRGVFTALCFF